MHLRHDCAPEIRKQPSCGLAPLRNAARTGRFGQGRMNVAAKDSEKKTAREATTKKGAGTKAAPAASGSKSEMAQLIADAKFDKNVMDGLAALIERSKSTEGQVTEDDLQAVFEDTDFTDDDIAAAYKLMKTARREGGREACPAPARGATTSTRTSTPTSTTTCSRTFPTRSWADRPSKSTSSCPRSLGPQRRTRRSAPTPTR